MKIFLFSMFALSLYADKCDKYFIKLDQHLDNANRKMLVTMYDRHYIFYYTELVLTKCRNKLNDEEIATLLELREDTIK